MVVIAGAHGLWLLPAILSLVGGHLSEPGGFGLFVGLRFRVWGLGQVFVGLRFRVWGLGLVFVGLRFGV